MDYLGKDFPKLGFGLMRLPMLGDEVDIEQLKQMTDAFIKAGFSYFDTAYGYIGGKSEAAIKTALVDRYPRDSFLLATKLPAWAGVKTAEEAKQMFYTSLERTAAGYFDFYLLHNMGEGRTKCFDDFGIWEFAAELREKGLIKHLGFSFHDKAEALDELLTKHPEAEFVQLQINYADWENPQVQSRLCYETARKHNKPVIIMEPVKGGLLAALPEGVKEIFNSANPNVGTASWALRFAASLPGVITVLSGMSTLGQMQDNLATFKPFSPLSEPEREVISKALKELESRQFVPCTSCKYCMEVCSNSIGIPGIFEALNMARVYENTSAAKGKYSWSTKGKGLNPAVECLKCAKCEDVCPQHINIIEMLEAASEIFD